MKKLILFLFISVSSFAIYSCEDSNPLNFNLFSLEDDKQLGLQLDQEIRNNPSEYPILNNSQATSILQEMINNLLTSPEIKYKEQFAYQVTIIRDDNTVNAFCTPGGYIYVYTGLIKFLDNEAGLVGVLGHEIAHAEHRHATTRMTKAYGLSVLASIILGSNPDQTAEIAANLLTGAALLKNSRSDETQSDESSFNYMKTSQWYPGGIKYFFEKIGANQTAGYLETLLSTHPDPMDRLNDVNKLLTNNNIPAPTDANTFPTRYQQLISLLP